MRAPQYNPARNAMVIVQGYETDNRWKANKNSGKSPLSMMAERSKESRRGGNENVILESPISSLVSQVDIQSLAPVSPFVSEGNNPRNHVEIIQPTSFDLVVVDVDANLLKFDKRGSPLLTVLSPQSSQDHSISNS
nr:hypothetical protein CFP56_07307 [Quercus suber]